MQHLLRIFIMPQINTVNVLCLTFGVSFIRLCKLAFEENMSGVWGECFFYILVLCVYECYNSVSASLLIFRENSKEEKELALNTYFLTEV